MNTGRLADVHDLAVRRQHKDETVKGLESKLRYLAPRVLSITVFCPAPALAPAPSPALHLQEMAAQLSWFEYIMSAYCGFHAPAIPQTCKQGDITEGFRNPLKQSYDNYASSKYLFTRGKSTNLLRTPG